MKCGNITDSNVILNMNLYLFPVSGDNVSIESCLCLVTVLIDAQDAPMEYESKQQDADCSLLHSINNIVINNKGFLMSEQRIHT